MKIETKRAYQEVHCILEQMPEEYTDKLPDKMKELIEYSRDKSYKPNLDLSKDLNKQNISDKAVNILAVLYYKYWTLTDVEKKELYDFLMAETEKNRKKFKLKQVEEETKQVNNKKMQAINYGVNPIYINNNNSNDSNNKITEPKKEYIPHPNYYPVVKEKKGFFRRLIDRLKEIFS